MYFDFEDYHPDITPVGSVISWREGVLLSIILHLAGVIVILLAGPLCAWGWRTWSNTGQGRECRPSLRRQDLKESRFRNGPI